MLRELLQEFRQIDTSRKSLRSFGLVVGAVFAAVAMWFMWRASFSQLADWRQDGSPGFTVILGISGILLIALGLLVPRTLRFLYLAWMGLAMILGVVMTRVILTVVFVLVVTPTGIVMRLLGKDLLDRRIDPSIESYWVSREDADWSAERLEKYY